MCCELQALADSIRRWTSQVDVGSLTPVQAAAVVSGCARIEATLATVKALAVARAAEADGWKLEGFRSPADQLAHQVGISPGAARRIVDTGRRLSSQPEVAAAGLAGELSAEQAEVISDAAQANPARTADLLEHAGRPGLGELRERAARAKAEVADLEARRRALHARRSLRRWADTDGGYHVRLYGPPEDAVRLWQAIDPIRRRLILLRRQTGSPNQALDALDYDALMTLAHIATGQDPAELGFTDLAGLGLFPQAALPTAGPVTPADDRTRRPPKLAGRPAKILVRVDLDTLLRGYPIAGELCEIPGYGPIPVSVIEDLLASGQTFLAAVLTKGKQLIGVHHRGRHPNRHQQSALEFLYPACAAAGCNSRDIQWDHRTDWVKTKYTLLDGMDGLCRHHHRLKTEKNWALTPGAGKRPFVPPTDRRHPDHPFNPDGEKIPP